MERRYKKPSPSVSRAFTIVALTGSTLRSMNNKDDYWEAVAHNIAQTMRVYHHKVGHDFYVNLSKDIQKIWEELLNESTTYEQPTDIWEMASCIANLIPEQQFRELILQPQPQVNIADKQTKQYQKEAVLALAINDKVNKLFKLKSYSIALPVIKKKKVIKKRNKPKSKAQIKHETEQLGIQADKKRKTDFLKNRIAEARRIKNESIK